MYGYIWPKWIQSGRAGEFRVHSTEPFHLSLWRYGLSKEFVSPIGWFDEHGPRANTQILPDGDFTQTGVHWNRNGYTKTFKPEGDCLLQGADTSGCALQCLCQSQLVTAPSRSGLYFFHAETPSGKFLSFPWVVAPATPQARVAIIASTNTWNAYNNFGGRSNYINANALPPRPTVNARLDLGRYNGALAGVWQFRDEEYAPLSFDRPEPFNHIPKDVQLTDPIRGRQACHLAETEWRLLGWMEREGFGYDLYADYQLHDGRLDLDAYDVLVLSTHPEYWSREAYLQVKRWVFERGGRLMYLGGNGIDCEVELSAGSTMRCRTWLPTPAGVPFVDPATGQRYDCRFHHKLESPAELLGVVFSEAGCATSAPFRAVDTNHWIFAGTGLKEGDKFGAHSLHERCPGGASGHETDKRTPSAPPATHLLARGMNANDGGAEMVYHEAPVGGGAVFSVGSITWPACVLIDEACSKITRNVLERMLAMPRQSTGTATTRTGAVTTRGTS
jgi:hypothetical protein